MAVRFSHAENNTSSQMPRSLFFKYLKEITVEYIIYCFCVHQIDIQKVNSNGWELTWLYTYVKYRIMQCLTYKRRLHVSSVQVLSCTKMVNDVALSHLCINKCQLSDPDVVKAIAVAVLYMYVIFVFFLLSVIVII